MNELAALNQLALVRPSLFTEQRVQRHTGGCRGRETHHAPSGNPEPWASREGWHEGRKYLFTEGLTHGQKSVSLNTARRYHISLCFAAISLCFAVTDPVIINNAGGDTHGAEKQHFTLGSSAHSQNLLQYSHFYCAKYKTELQKKKKEKTQVYPGHIVKRKKASISTPWN